MIFAHSLKSNGHPGRILSFRGTGWNFILQRPQKRRRANVGKPWNPYQAYWRWMHIHALATALCTPSKCEDRAETWLLPRHCCWWPRLPVGTLMSKHLVPVMFSAFIHSAIHCFLDAEVLQAYFLLCLSRLALLVYTMQPGNSHKTDITRSFGSLIITFALFHIILWYFIYLILFYTLHSIPLDLQPYCLSEKTCSHFCASINSKSDFACHREVTHASTLTWSAGPT